MSWYDGEGWHQTAAARKRAARNDKSWEARGWIDHRAKASAASTGGGGPERAPAWQCESPSCGCTTNWATKSKCFKCGLTVLQAKAKAAAAVWAPTRSAAEASDDVKTEHPHDDEASRQKIVKMQNALDEACRNDWYGEETRARMQEHLLYSRKEHREAKTPDAQLTCATTRAKAAVEKRDKLFATGIELQQQYEDIERKIKENATAQSAASEKVDEAEAEVADLRVSTAMEKADHANQDRGPQAALSGELGPGLAEFLKEKHNLDVDRCATEYASYVEEKKEKKEAKARAAAEEAKEAAANKPEVASGSGGRTAAGATAPTTAGGASSEEHASDERKKAMDECTQALGDPEFISELMASNWKESSIDDKDGDVDMRQAFATSFRKRVTDGHTLASLHVEHKRRKAAAVEPIPAPAPPPIAKAAVAKASATPVAPAKAPAVPAKAPAVPAKAPAVPAKAPP